MQPAYAYGWYGAPFIRLLIPLVSGILIGNYLQPPLKAIWILMAAFSLFYFLLEKQTIRKKFYGRWLTGICLNLLLIAMGVLLIMLHKYHKAQVNIAENETESTSMALTIEEVLGQNNGTDRFVAAIRLQCKQGVCSSFSGGCLLSVRKDSTDRNWEPGQILLIRKQPRLIRDNGNPGGFSFRQYYARQGIQYQVYLNRNEYVVCQQKAQKGFRNLLYTIRLFVIKTIRKLIPGEKEQGLAEALLIGYRNDLDKQLVRSYSRMGVVHIIAISGLHLGMIYGLLLLLIKPFQQQKGFRWVKPIVLLSVLWMFTLLAGGAPSVLRSALMFSFIITG
ncbi:MAG: ComEC family competence protein, partial [Bacteroidota bacterium]|nr:ComEC family competence protein [Bacteroidota bacterium]